MPTWTTDPPGAVTLTAAAWVNREAWWTSAFTGTDDADLAAPWAVAPDFADSLIYNTNRAKGQGGILCGNVYDTRTVRNGYASVKTKGTSSYHHEILARIQTNGSGYYIDHYDGAIKIYRTIHDGGSTEVASVASTLVDGYVMRVSIAENIIIVEYNGVVVLTYTDTDAGAILTAGKWGIASSTSATTLFDDFEMGAVGPSEIAVTTSTWDDTAPVAKAV